MTTRRIAVISAGLSNPSSTRMLADRLAAETVKALAGYDVDASVDVIELRDYAHDITNNLLTGFAPPALESAINTVVSADALIAGCYLAGTNTRRVRRALGALFGGAVGKDIVSRTWRKVKGDWDAWNTRSLAGEPIVRLILDGTVVRVRLDRKATSISLLVVLGVREDGQKVLLAIKQMGGESTEAWRTVLDDLIGRGLRRPEFIIVDGAPGLDRAIAAVWNGVPVQRCTVHKHRNLFAHAPERLHDEITADYNDMIYAETREEIEVRRKAFIRKWRLKHRAVADSLEEAGDRLFTFTRLPPSQWRSARTTNAIERLHEEFKRRIKTQTVVLTQNSKKARKHRVFGAAAIPSSAFSRFCPPSVPCSCCGYAAAPRWNSNSSPCGIS